MSLTQLYTSLSLLSVVTTLLLAGLYFIFHNTVMPVLAEREGAAVMKRINEVIVNPPFLFIFLVSPISSLLAMMIGFINATSSMHPLAIGGYGLAVLGWVITITQNIPLNNALHRIENHDAFWVHYVTVWKRWNTLRYYVSLMSSTLVLASSLFD
ncbi:anthrone oxygenase family protein [Vibrio vulnificus]|uniref:anthrone oxygenase family protein n=1 Tax=Vibrio vulnificus TaxID=672 RepID=UPI001CCB6782|nr:anthrone oxygenase family protein [Vibrio vulnificus]MCA0761760.1 DUF1772 domain-containing protein [Vibrio vulnificus]